MNFFRLLGIQTNTRANTSPRPSHSVRRPTVLSPTGQSCLSVPSSRTHHLQHGRPLDTRPDVAQTCSFTRGSVPFSIFVVTPSAHNSFSEIAYLGSTACSVVSRRLTITALVPAVERTCSSTMLIWCGCDVIMSHTDATTKRTELLDKVQRMLSAQPRGRLDRCVWRHRTQSKNDCPLFNMTSSSSSLVPFSSIHFFSMTVAVSSGPNTPATTLVSVGLERLRVRSHTHVTRRKDDTPDK